MKALKVRVKDDLSLVDRLNTTKQWFNGAKKFFTVKVLPVRRK